MFVFILIHTFSEDKDPMNSFTAKNATLYYFLLPPSQITTPFISSYLSFFSFLDTFLLLCT
jgi:hypothetical protein